MTRRGTQLAFPQRVKSRDRESLHGLEQIGRQIHRWLSIVFTMTVVANFVSTALGKPSGWIAYSPLLPLFLMLFTGLYMLVLPYVAKWRACQTGGLTNTTVTKAKKKVGPTRTNSPARLLDARIEELWWRLPFLICPPVMPWLKFETRELPGRCEWRSCL